MWSLYNGKQRCSWNKTTVNGSWIQTSAFIISPLLTFRSISQKPTVSTRHFEPFNHRTGLQREFTVSPGLRLSPSWLGKTPDSSLISEPQWLESPEVWRGTRQIWESASHTPTAKLLNVWVRLNRRSNGLSEHSMPLRNLVSIFSFDSVLRSTQDSQLMLAPVWGSDGRKLSLHVRFWWY